MVCVDYFSYESQIGNKLKKKNKCNKILCAITNGVFSKKPHDSVFFLFTKGESDF